MFRERSESNNKMEVKMRVVYFWTPPWISWSLEGFVQDWSWVEPVSWRWETPPPDQGLQPTHSLRALLWEPEEPKEKEFKTMKRTLRQLVKKDYCSQWFGEMKKAWMRSRVVQMKDIQRKIPPLNMTTIFDSLRRSGFFFYDSHCGYKPDTL